jgi:hypothetical protein
MIKNNVSDEEKLIIFEKMVKDLELMQLNLNKTWADSGRAPLPKFLQAKIVLNDEISDYVKKLNLLIFETLKDMQTTNISKND